MVGTQVPKSRLMGFGDCAHGEAKHLRVHFLCHGRPHVASLADQVCGSVLMQRVLQMQLCMRVVCRACAITPLRSEPIPQACHTLSHAPPCHLFAASLECLRSCSWPCRRRVHCLPRGH